jgi:type III secretion system chaperone SycN
MNSQISTAIAEFGHSIGIDHLKCNRKGVVCLSLEKFGKLYFEPKDEVLFIYLVREIPFFDKAKMIKSLEFTHSREKHPYPVQVGLKGQGTVVFCVHLPFANCQLHELQTAATFLKKLHERLDS